MSCASFAKQAPQTASRLSYAPYFRNRYTANKRIDIALRSLYGIGPATSAKVLENAKIDPATRAHT